MGQLYALIEEHMNQSGYRISARQVAAKLEVSPTTLKNWQNPKELIEKRHLVAIAELTRVPYQRVLDALLADIGYLNREDPPPAGNQGITGA